MIRGFCCKAARKSPFGSHAQLMFKHLITKVFSFML